MNTSFKGMSTLNNHSSSSNSCRSRNNSTGSEDILHIIHGDHVDIWKNGRLIHVKKDCDHCSATTHTLSDKGKEDPLDLSLYEDHGSISFFDFDEMDSRIFNFR